MKQLALLWLIGATLFVLTGCLEVKERLLLNADRSGEYHFQMKMDLTDLVELAAASQPDLSTEEVVQQMMEGQDAGLPEITAPASMPPGLRWLDGGTRIDGAVVMAGFGLGFDHIDALRQPVQVGEDAEPQVYLRVDVVEKGRKLLISGNPYEGVDQLQNEDPESAQFMEMFGQDIVFSYVVDARDMKVKGNDSTRQEGGVLTWEFGLDDLMKGGRPIKAALKR